jgi:hypothetical protein
MSLGEQAWQTIEATRQPYLGTARAGERLIADRFAGPRVWIADLAAYAPSAIQPPVPSRTAMTTRPENRESGCPLQPRDRHLILRLTVAATNDNVGRKELVAHHAFPFDDVDDLRGVCRALSALIGRGKPRE